MASDSGAGGKLKGLKQKCGEDGVSGDVCAYSPARSEVETNLPMEELLSSEYQNEPPVQKSVEISCIDDKGINKSIHREDENEHVEHKEEKICALPSTPFQLLTNYKNRFRRLQGKKLNVQSYETECIKVADLKLSTIAIIRLAGEKFTQSPKCSSGEMLMGGHYFSGTLFCLTKEETRDLELVSYLLAAAEKVGEKQFDHARKLLEQCDKLNSYEGDPVQRLGYYFSEALHERINQESGNSISRNLGKKHLLDVEQAMMSPNPTALTYYKVMPLGQITQFSGIQAIEECVAGKRKIHIIDLAIRSGNQHTILIQDLAMRSECPLELLKITAIGTSSKPKLEETGSRLTTFAQSLNLPISFDVVMVEDFLHLDEGILSIDSDEVVVVYAEYFLRTLVGQPDRLESLLRVIRNTKPCLMVVAEVEANHNSPVFVNRFIEALFYFGAQFDSFEDCMKHDEANRLNQESFYFSKSIHNILAAEGDDRTFRHVKIEVWRAFFARFGMVETKLSMSSMYQADLLLKKFPCAGSCTLDMDGECLIMGWKETPLYSLSAWRFK